MATYTGAINHALELTFGWKSRSSEDQVILLTGRSRARSFHNVGRGSRACICGGTEQHDVNSGQDFDVASELDIW